ncbi:MAG TPA: MtrB/PioB family outer membrane beta-barrel protein [Pyrinomonadaceae bacterium]|nr:MtrB/PioB family outer membrane beta-barrel protein [Pyrinomonadaceae bacterium]
MRIQLERLKSILRAALVLITCVISLVLLTTHVLGQTPDKDETKPKTQTPNIHGTIEFGAQLRDTQGGHTAKFQEVRDVPKGIFIQNLKLDFNSADSPYWLAIRGYEIRERDQRIGLNFERIGKYRTQFIWDQIPHSFGTGQSFLQRTEPGLYQVSPTLRASLQAVTQPDATRTPVNGPLPTLVRQELRTAPFTNVRLRRDQALFRQTYQPSENVEVYFQVSWLRNRGTRPMSAGTFVRRAVPGGGLADIGGSWEGLGQEFLEPIDQRTTDFKVGAQFSGKRWRAGAEYDLSLFRNRIESLIFENPFRVTDEEGCLPNPPPLPPLTCGAQNRFRMVRWQNDLPPNNDSHTITFWASLDVTPQTQMRALFSLAYWSQNDPFLPWTQNTAIVPTHWDALSPITRPTDVNQLPARSLNGKMRNINQEYALVNRSNSFRFQAQYRSQFLDNQSPMIVFPGYAAFGDSSWRAARTDFYNLPIENLDWDFRRQNIDAGFQWDVLPQLTWRADYDWEIWNRKFRDVNRNNQHSIRNRLDFEFNLSGNKSNAAKDPSATTTASRPAQGPRPKDVTTLRFKLDYTYANRRALAYNTQPLTFVSNFAGSPANGPTTAWVVTSFTTMNDGFPIEFNLLRRFDETSRTRNDGSFTFELLKGERTNFSASYHYLGDEYDKNFYGLLFNRSSFVDAQFTHAFENGSFFYATYSLERNHFKYRDLAHLLPNPAAPPGAIVQGTLAQYPIANTWERTSANRLDSFEFGINWTPQEGKWKKWEFDFSYALSAARDQITTVNPFPVRADSVLHAGANPYPDTVVQRQDVNVAVSRKIKEGFEIGGRYWYEPYHQNDFSYNVLAPYVHGNLTSDTPKYLFQDARYGSYHSNVATVFIRYSF